MIGDKDEHIDLHADDKAAAVTCKTKIFPEFPKDSHGHVLYRYPNNGLVRSALQDFMDDKPLPAKSFADLIKTLRRQMLIVKDETRVSHV